MSAGSQRNTGRSNPETASAATRPPPRTAVDGRPEFRRLRVPRSSVARSGALGEAARPALEKALAASPAPEARRRLEELRDKLNGDLAGEDLRGIRAVDVLEQIGTDPAGDVEGSCDRRRRVTDDASSPRRPWRRLQIIKGSSRIRVGSFHSFGSMQVRIFSRRYSSSRKP